MDPRALPRPTRFQRRWAYLRYRLWRIFTRNGRQSICLPDGSCCMEDE